MNSKKCMTCGLVNFETVEVCRRCGSAVSAAQAYVTSPVSTVAVSAGSVPYNAPAPYGAPRVEGSWVQTPNEAENDEQRAMVKKYVRKMIVGLLWAGGGTAVTVFSFVSAASSEGGGRYVIAWGAIAVGIIDFLIGLAGWLKHKS